MKAGHKLITSAQVQCMDEHRARQLLAMLICVYFMALLSVVVWGIGQL